MLIDLYSKYWNATILALLKGVVTVVATVVVLDPEVLVDGKVVDSLVVNDDDCSVVEVVGSSVTLTVTPKNKRLFEISYLL